MIHFQDFWGSSNLSGCSPTPQHPSSPTNSNLFNCHFHGKDSNLFSLLACLNNISFLLNFRFFPVKWSRIKWNEQGPTFVKWNLLSLSVILPSQYCSDPTSVFRNQIRSESMCMYVHIWASSHMDKSWAQYLWSNWDTLFSAAISKYWFTNSGMYKRKFSKGRDRSTTQGSITDYINNLDFSFSLWLLQAYFYLCFITKPFLLLDYL